MSEVIRDSLSSGRLQCLDSGQGSPCLDLAKLNKNVTDTMVEKEVDLLVLEGMGRAVHTNLYTRHGIGQIYHKVFAVKKQLSYVSIVVQSTQLSFSMLKRSGCLMTR